MISFTLGDPNRELPLEIVLRVSIGAGEMCEVADALKWSLPERRKLFGTNETPTLDKLWGEHSYSGNLIARESGFSMNQLKDTLAILEEHSGAPLTSIGDIQRAINIIDEAVEALASAGRHVGLWGEEING